MKSQLKPDLTERIRRFVVEKREVMSWQIEAYFQIPQRTSQRYMEHLRLKGLVAK